jgi:hypothetical protein
LLLLLLPKGYLKFSVSVVGPPDRLHVHKDNEDDGNGSKDLSSMVKLATSQRERERELKMLSFAEA